MAEPGKHLGVAGLGGLGHVAVKFGKAFGLKVTVISTSSKKEDEAIKKLGADSFLLSSDPAKMNEKMRARVTALVEEQRVEHPLGEEGGDETVIALPLAS
ncbi:hypothetical protein LguiB_032940 [Lonicera macranthoides]